MDEAVFCFECGAALEIIQTRPVSVDLTLGAGFDDDYLEGGEDDHF